MVPWRNSVRKRSALAPAAFIDPCLPSRAERAPVADGWVHEIKHDGFRLQIHARGKRVRLYTMTGVDWTDALSVDRRGRRAAQRATRHHRRRVLLRRRRRRDRFRAPDGARARCQRLCLCVRSAGDRRRRHARASR